MPRLRPVPTDDLTTLVEAQHGVVGREQLLGMGLTDGQIARALSARWQRTDHDGVYLTRTGPVPYLVRCWAALLHAGDGAALGLATAAWIWGLDDAAPDLVHVMIPADRRVARQPGARFHIRTHLAERVHPARRPTVVRLEDTVLDLVDRPGTTSGDVIDVVLRACQRRLTSAGRLRAAMARRKKLRHRALVAELLADVEDGVLSPLERRYAHDVERAHGLPPGSRNRQEGSRGRRRYRDVRYLRYRTVVELDGRAAHPDEQREADNVRDNELLVDEGCRTLRYGWRSVTVAACETAGQVGMLLRSGGWTGSPRRCGPGCRLAEP